MPTAAKKGKTAGQSTSGRKKTATTKPKTRTVTGALTPVVRSNRSKHPWDVVMTTFVEGLVVGPSDSEPKFMSLREIADHFDISYNLVREKAAQERWSERKADYQARAARDRQRKRIAKLSEQAVSFDENSLNAAKLGTALVIQRLAEVTKEVQTATQRRLDAYERLSLGQPVEKWELYPAVNYRELDGLSKSLALFQQVGQRALGTDVQKHEITGANGGPLELDFDGEVTVDVKSEMLRDDPHRIAQLLKAVEAAGLLPIGIENIIDGEVVEDDEDSQEEDEDSEDDDTDDE